MIMASIGTDPNGFRRILFVAGDGKRKTVRLGKVSHANANTAREMIEALLSAQVTGGTVKPHVQSWVDGLDDVLRGRLVAVGLVSKQRHGSTSLSMLFDEFFATLKVKP